MNDLLINSFPDTFFLLKNLKYLSYGEKKHIFIGNEEEINVLISRIFLYQFSFLSVQIILLFRWSLSELLIIYII